MSKALLVINDQTFTEKDVMQGIDNVLVNLNDTGDLTSATKVLTSLDLLSNISGKAKAYLLWGMNSWYAQNVPGEDFGDYVESTTGTKRITVARYINVWKQIDDEQIPKAVQEKPIRELVPIASLIEQGFIPTKKEWGKIELASNSSELGAVIREIKGKKPRKSSRQNQMERDGSIYTWKNDIRKYVGFFDVETAKTDPDVAEAIEQIISGKPIIRK